MDTTQRRAWGPVVRAAREAAGLTQQGLADKAGVHRRTVGSIERGAGVGQPGKLVRILAVLGLEEPRRDDEVDAFVESLKPLLIRLSSTERARVMPAVVGIIAGAIEHQHDTAG